MALRPGRAADSGVSRSRASQRHRPKRRRLPAASRCRGCVSCRSEDSTGDLGWGPQVLARRHATPGDISTTSSWVRRLTDHAGKDQPKAHDAGDSCRSRGVRLAEHHRIDELVRGMDPFQNWGRHKGAGDAERPTASQLSSRVDGRAVIGPDVGSVRLARLSGEGARAGAGPVAGWPPPVPLELFVGFLQILVFVGDQRS
jgi:hypothetical protein